MCSVLSRNLFKIKNLFHNSSHIIKRNNVNLSSRIFKKLYSTNDKFETILKDDNEEHNLTPGIKSKFDEFRDENIDIIFDVDEEKKRLDLEIINATQHITDPYEGLNMKHGVNGVFDIEDLIEILKKDKAQNIFVTKVPYEQSYVDYMVIVTGKSQRHMSALATYIRKIFKLIRHCNEPLPKIEGANSNDWIAIDLGNIALHIFSTKIRELYDLETLWSVGSNYDRVQNNGFDNDFDDRFTTYLSEFQPDTDPTSCSKSIETSNTC